MWVTPLVLLKLSTIYCTNRNVLSLNTGEACFLDAPGKHKLKLCWKIRRQDVCWQHGLKAHTHKTDPGEGFHDGTTAATAHLAKASSAAVHTTLLLALESKRN